MCIVSYIIDSIEYLSRFRVMLWPLCFDSPYLHMYIQQYLVLVIYLIRTAFCFCWSCFLKRFCDEIKSSRNPLKGLQPSLSLTTRLPFSICAQLYRARNGCLSLLSLLRMTIGLWMAVQTPRSQ